MTNPIFKSLAEELRETGAKAKELDPEYYQEELVLILEQSGWKRRYPLNPMLWPALVFEKDGCRVLIDRRSGRKVDYSQDCHECVFSKRTRLIGFGFLALMNKEQKIMFAGRVTGTELRLWFKQDEHVTL